MYDTDLSALADKFHKYYPINLEPKTVEITNNVLKLIDNCLQFNDMEKIQKYIFYWEFYNDTINSGIKQNESFLEDAAKYASLYPEEDEFVKKGQYLYNRSLLEKPEEGILLVRNKKVFSQVVDNYKDNKFEVINALCKYEDYSELKKEEKQYISNILKIFDYKNPIDKIVLKYVIDDYIHMDTVYSNPENIKMPQITISKISKEAILDKYKYPNCIEFFEAFENSMINFSDRSGSSGLKKVRPDRIVDYTMELKIKGYTDRLFSSNNDYVFDIYSDRGLH